MKSKKQNAKFPFPGLPATIDGSGMVVWVETHIGEFAGAYPITSSQTMGNGFQNEVAAGRKNLWGEPLDFLEPESEHSAQSACEGAALSGGRVTNFTSGQGLILMKEVLYVISGKRLPMILHVGARTLTSHALNVHCGHDDLFGVTDVGWGMIVARNVQDVGDLSLIARRVSEETGVPFMVIQDGFLTTHTLETCALPEPELMKDFVGNPREKLRNHFDPAHPMLSGPVQNQDAYMKGKIAQRSHYDLVPAALRKAMEDFERLTGRKQSFLHSYKMDDARMAIVAMGTMYETATVAVDYLRESRGLRVGAVHITSLRPFPGEELVRTLGKTRAVAVLERLDIPLGQSNPLTMEVKSALADAAMGREGYPRRTRLPDVYSAAAGLGGRDVRVSDIIAAFEHIGRKEERRRFFVLGIDHPLAAQASEKPVIRPSTSFSVRGHSVGGWGSITTNKIIATLMGDHFGLQVQAYPKYGSEKKGLPTNYFLILSKERIRTHHELEAVDLVAVHDTAALEGPNPFAGLRPGGWAYLQTPLRTPEEIAASIPERLRTMLRELHATVLAIDAGRISAELAPRADLQRRMQGIVLLGVFLRVMPFRDARSQSKENVLAQIEPALRKYFGRRGAGVVEANLQAIERGYEEVVMIPASALAGARRSHAATPR